MSLTKTQVMQLIKNGDLHEVFTHTTLGRFDVGALRRHTQHMKAQGEQPLHCLFDHVRADSGDPYPMAYLTSQREVDAARVAELTEEEINDPVIFVVCPAGLNSKDETHLLVDGIHRLTARYQRGYKDFQMWFIPWHVADRLRPPQHAINIPWGRKDIHNGQLVDRE